MSVATAVISYEFKRNMDIGTGRTTDSLYTKAIEALPGTILSVERLKSKYDNVKRSLIHWTGSWNDTTALLKWQEDNNKNLRTRIDVTVIIVSLGELQDAQNTWKHRR